MWKVILFRTLTFFSLDAVCISKVGNYHDDLYFLDDLKFFSHEFRLFPMDLFSSTFFCIIVCFLLPFDKTMSCFFQLFRRCPVTIKSRSQPILLWSCSVFRYRRSGRIYRFPSCQHAFSTLCFFLVTLHRSRISCFAACSSLSRLLVPHFARSFFSFRQSALVSSG